MEGGEEVGGAGGDRRPRRRVRTAGRRDRQVVVRFSEAELALIKERAALAGLAVGAWIGHTVLDVAEQTAVEPRAVGRGAGQGIAEHGVVGQGAAERAAAVRVGLPDLLRLHSDVTALAAVAGPDDAAQLRVLLVRLDAAVDAAVANHGGAARGTEARGGGGRR